LDFWICLSVCYFVFTSIRRRRQKFLRFCQEEEEEEETEEDIIQKNDDGDFANDFANVVVGITNDDNDSRAR
tara:strand:+ start:627 stop:842 length:216 start_codon:yes stop_codon:yes gene_type:complete